MTVRADIKTNIQTVLNALVPASFKTLKVDVIERPEDLNRITRPALYISSGSAVRNADGTIGAKPTSWTWSVDVHVLCDLSVHEMLIGLVEVEMMKDRSRGGNADSGGTRLTSITAPLPVRVDESIIYITMEYEIKYSHAFGTT